MQEIMTITLSGQKPNQLDNGEFTMGDEAVIFKDENGAYGYQFHGVNFKGDYYELQAVTGFATKQAATKSAFENYNVGTGC